MTKAKDKSNATPGKQREEAKTGMLREKAMLAHFGTGRWYGTGADEKVITDLRKKHEATGDIGTFTKRFMSRDRLAAINACVNEARRFHRAMTLPWGDSGARLLSADLFFDYKREMTAYEMRFNEAVEEFLTNFPTYVKKEKERLAGLFKETDYPSADELRSRFRFTLQIEAIPSAEDFRVDLGDEEVKRIRGDIEKQVDASMKEASLEIWERMSDLVEKVVERLKDSSVQIRKPLFDNLRELVAVLPKLNMTNDPKLKEMGERLAKEILKEDVAAIRDDEGLRSEVAKKADKLLDVMKTFGGKAKAKPSAKK